jgi:hypothetical protein
MYMTRRLQVESAHQHLKKFQDECTKEIGRMVSIELRWGLGAFFEVAFN